MDDRDTHCGELQTDGTVLARCGIRFAPRWTALGSVALPGHPYDRADLPTVLPAQGHPVSVTTLNRGVEAARLLDTPASG